MKTKEKIILILIFALGMFLRFYNINWDSGYSMHPDERAIVLYTLPLNLPTSIDQFFNQQSPLNPHFFAYGSFPLYLLKIAGFFASLINPLFDQYPFVDLVGRSLSALFDSATMLLIYLIGKKTYNKDIGIIGSFLYAISVFPIQVAHFYAVDTMLTFFIMLTLYKLIIFYERPTLLNSFLVGIFFGLGLATKDSALALLSSVGITLSVDFLLIFIKNPHRISLWFPHVSNIIYKLAKEGFVISLVAFITFFIFEPYAIIDFASFWMQTLQQSQMTHDAFTFPYTLQYVGITPYWYELKNIFLWGQGPFLATLSSVGVLYVVFMIIRKNIHGKWAKDSIIMTFFISYIVVVGHFAVGFMRYMLPIYPILTLCAALFLYDCYWYFHAKWKIFLVPNILALLVVIGLFVWPLSFMHIYRKENTRVTASMWISQYIPPGSTIATEYWDDALPLFDQTNYKMESLSLYTPDTPEKWQTIYQQLQHADYVIIASNRVYTPLEKLTNCTHLPSLSCYKETATYYNNLFSGKLGFAKVAEFSSYPQLPFTNITVNDQSADESFTVYDHPKVMIFKKIALSNLLGK